MKGSMYFTMGIAFFAALLTVIKRPNQVSDKILVVFLGSVILPLVFKNIQSTFSFFHRLDASILHFLPLSLGPLMHLYTGSLTHKDFRIDKQALLHFTPLLLFTIIGLCLQSPITMTFIPSLNDGTKLVGMITSLSFIFSFLFYSIFIQIQLRHHRKKILDCFAHTPTRITLTWLTWLVLIFFNLFALTHIPAVLKAQNLIQLSSSIGLVTNPFHNTGLFLFIISLSFFGVGQTMVFPKSEQTNLKQDSIGEKPQGKYKTSKLKEEQLQEYLTRLENRMVSEKPYLDGDLTLSDLAKDLNLPKHHLTETINCKLEKNFFTYINGYRVAEAKQLLINPEKANLTILEISHLAGFNSKSTFNIFFKKSTQISPSQFRKKHLS